MGRPSGSESCRNAPLGHARTCSGHLSGPAAYGWPEQVQCCPVQPSGEVERAPTALPSGPFPSCLNAPFDSLFRHARTCSGHLPPPLPPDGRMDARNKSGHDDMRGGHDGKRGGTLGVDPSPDSAEPLETRLNPGHAPCPPNLNRTAVGRSRSGVRRRRRLRFSVPSSRVAAPAAYRGTARGIPSAGSGRLGTDPSIRARWRGRYSG